MAALKNGLHWRHHDDALLKVGEKWKLIGNDEETEGVKNITFRASGDGAFFSNKQDSIPPFPNHVLQQWLGENALRLKGLGLSALITYSDFRDFDLEFGPYVTLSFKIDPTYDVNMQEDEALHEIETMTLPLKISEERTFDGITSYGAVFKIPRILVRDFLLSIMRMGGPELHCDRAQLEKFIEALVSQKK